MFGPKESKLVPGVPILPFRQALPYFKGNAYETLDAGAALANGGPWILPVTIPTFHTFGELRDRLMAGSFEDPLLGLWEQLRASVRHQEIIVFSNRELVTQVMGMQELAFFEEEPLYDVAGQYAPLFATEEKHEEARKASFKLVGKLKQVQQIENQKSVEFKVRDALLKAAQEGLDLGDVLKDVFMEWLIQAAIKDRSVETDVNQIKATLLEWLGHVNGPAVFFKPLRQFKPWSGAEALAERLKDQLGYGGDPVAWDAFRTTVLAFDSVVATAVNALIHAESLGWRPGGEKNTDDIIKETLKNTPPITLAVRQAVKEVTIEGYRIPEGMGIGANLRETGYPFGFGAHRCVGEHFAPLPLGWVLNGFPWADYRPVISGYIRNRLNTAPKKPRAKKRNTWAVHPISPVSSVSMVFA